LPGVGKSTFARAYAQLSRTEFVELDQYVERLAGKSIAEIFDKDGEAAFRELEANCLERLLKRQRCTVALGGGTLTNTRSLQLARELGCIVLLTGSAHDIAARLWEQKQTRPLLKSCESQAALEQRLEELWSERKEGYSAADLLLDTSYSSVDNLKIELAWLERQIVSVKANSEQEFESSPLRAIPLADPNYRSPREQRSGGEIVDRMERLLKSQKQKDRGERKERRERKGNRTVRGDSAEGGLAERQIPKSTGPRSRRDALRPRADGPQPRVDGPQPRVDGPQPRADGPQPRADGPQPRADGPRHRGARHQHHSNASHNRAKNRSGKDGSHGKSSTEKMNIAPMDFKEKQDD